MGKFKFKVGDIVIDKKNKKFGIGHVLGHLKAAEDILCVAYDNTNFRLNNAREKALDPTGKYNCKCWHSYERDLELQTTNKVVLYRNGNVVFAKDIEARRAAVAVCSPDDTFDFYIGAQIALLRLLKGVK